MSHTPSPWTHQGLEDDGEERGSVFLIGEDLGGMVGAALPSATELNDGDFSRVVANADFIVKAVNAHDELTEAVELLLTCVYAGYAPGNPTSDEAIAKGQAALAKAGLL